MRPEEQAIVKQKLREVAEILYKNTPSEELKTEDARCLWQIPSGSPN
jgi:hypothetical protein